MNAQHIYGWHWTNNLRMSCGNKCQKKWSMQQMEMNAENEIFAACSMPANTLERFSFCFHCQPPDLCGLCMRECVVCMICIERFLSLVAPALQPIYRHFVWGVSVTWISIHNEYTISNDWSMDLDTSLILCVCMCLWRAKRNKHDRARFGYCLLKKLRLPILANIFHVLNVVASFSLVSDRLQWELDIIAPFMYTS